MFQKIEILCSVRKSEKQAFHVSYRVPNSKKQVSKVSLILFVLQHVGCTEAPRCLAAAWVSLLWFASSAGKRRAQVISRERVDRADGSVTD